MSGFGPSETIQIIWSSRILTGHLFYISAISAGSGLAFQIL